MNIIAFVFCLTFFVDMYIYNNTMMGEPLTMRWGDEA